MSDPDDKEACPYARKGMVIPDRTGQLWWRGSLDLSQRDHSVVLFRVTGPPKLTYVTKRDTNILGEVELYDDYSLVHPVEWIIYDRSIYHRPGREWRESYFCWESERGKQEYTRIYED